MKFDLLDKLHLLGTAIAWGVFLCIGRIVNLVSLTDLKRNPIGAIIHLGLYVVFLRWWSANSHWRILRGPLFRKVGNKTEEA